MESRLSELVVPKMDCPEICKEITEIVQENLQARVSINRLVLSGEPIDKELLLLIRGAADVKPIDLIMTRRAN